MQFWTNFPKTLSQNLMHHHLLSSPGNSEIVHCGILLNMSYSKDSIRRVGLGTLLCHEMKIKSVISLPSAIHTIKSLILSDNVNSKHLITH